MLEFVLETFFGITGYAVLWLVTRGRWKPFEGRDECATLVGLAVWASLVGVVVALFFW